MAAGFAAGSDLAGTSGAGIARSCPEADLPVELQVHQKLSLPGREPAKARHPLSRALNEVATAQSAVVLEPLKARNCPEADLPVELQVH